MQYPPGSNNRLDEGGGNRNNNNRLMDTQNNAKGGYGYGGDSNNQAAPVSYMTGSKLSVAWTSQHSCGSMNAECQVLIQYMCNDGNTVPAGVVAATDTTPQGTGQGPLRDGTNNDSPDPDNPQANRGLHEPTAFYQACNNRERNKGLFTSDQNLNANDATRTRQNPNGARSGLECPEERDYYPYWAPSPWKDLMVMTNNLAQCAYYQQHSQNVEARGYCTGGNGDNQPNNEAGCTAAGGTWHTVAPFNIPAPECVTAPVQRDNHLGNDRTGNEVMANLTIPAAAGALGVDAAQACAIRLRYNITTADTRACSTPTLTTRELCENAGETWSAFYVDSSMDDNTLNSQPPLPDGNPKVTMGGLLSSGGGTDSILELAVNTNQYGRTFQDRSHVFSIAPRPLGVPANANIYNLNVKGKRGNIVQTYPATEYDFHPVDLVTGAQDLVHVQWTGNDNTNNNGNNNGEGTNNEDRHNIVQLDVSGISVPAPATQASMFDVMWEWNPEAAGTFGGPRAQEALTKQFALSKQTACDADPNNDQQRTNCEKLNNAAATVDLGLLRFKPGNYSYMSSRNNNFSNRAQKATITTLTEATVSPGAPTHVVATSVVLPGFPEQASVTVSWGPPGEEAPYIGTDGRNYTGYSQEARAPMGYTVQYSCDGGETWTPYTNCANSENSCQIDMLPAGTPCAFQVRSASTGGFSEPSSSAIALTQHSEASLACAQQLRANLNGEYLQPGAVAAIVVAVLAVVILIPCLVWFFMCGGAASFRRSPPPPPPGGKFDNIPPPPPPGGVQYGAAY